MKRKNILLFILVFLIIFSISGSIYAQGDYESINIYNQEDLEKAFPQEVTENIKKAEVKEEVFDEAGIYASKIIEFTDVDEIRFDDLGNIKLFFIHDYILENVDQSKEYLINSVDDIDEDLIRKNFGIDDGYKIGESYFSNIDDELTIRFEKEYLPGVNNAYDRHVIGVDRRSGIVSKYMRFDSQVDETPLILPESPIDTYTADLMAKDQSDERFLEVDDLKNKGYKIIIQKINDIPGNENLSDTYIRPVYFIEEGGIIKYVDYQTGQVYGYDQYEGSASVISSTYKNERISILSSSSPAKDNKWASRFGINYQDNVNNSTIKGRYIGDRSFYGFDM